MNWSTFWENKYMNGLFISKAMYMSGTGSQNYPRVNPPSQCRTILKDFRNAPPAKMLICCQNVIF